MAIRIANIISCYKPHGLGGAEICARVISEALVKKGHEVCVLTQSPNVSYVSVDGGVKVYRIPQFNVYSMIEHSHSPKALKPFWHTIDVANWVMAFRVFRILRREKPDIVYTHTIAGFSAAVWIAAKLNGIPIIHFLHDYYLLCPKSRMFENGKRCSRRCLLCSILSLPKKPLSTLIDGVCTNSEFVYERHRQFGLLRGLPTHTFFNPIDNAVQSSNFVDQKPSATEIVFGYVGRISAEKGVHLLIAAIRQTQNAQLLIFGKDDCTTYARQIIQSAEKIKNVRFMGFCLPEQIYSQIDVLVVPSVWDEPFGRIVPEAYMHGRPVIGARRGGISELVVENETGVLFDPESPQALLDAMSKFVDDPSLCQRMGRAALGASKGFETSIIVDGILTFTNKFLHEKT